ncbi:hypothetical protein tb265_09790 [Gemmatimonadetes bacterium T265]|nr:hypothetical protein tb265_09790 [Gemmatimonadetes bacterium T265]
MSIQNLVVRPFPGSAGPTTRPQVDAELDAAAGALVDALRGVVHALRGASRTAEQQLGVHGAELHVLRKLAEQPAAALAELAARTQTDPSTASVVVRGLVERGLVTRSVAPDDRRRTPIAITAAGRRVLRAAPEPAHTRVARAAAPLDAGEVRALAARLDGLAARLTTARGADGAEPSERDLLAVDAP